jgi:hypothetical protein
MKGSRVLAALILLALAACTPARQQGPSSLPGSRGPAGTGYTLVHYSAPW